MRTVAAIVASACVLALPTALCAQTAPVVTAVPPSPAVATTSAPPAAEEHYERSRREYASGHYRAAVDSLRTAIRLDPAGYNLYFDLGLVYERLGEVDRAVEAYTLYGQRTHDRDETERTRRIVARLAGARTELRDLRGRGRADALFWASTGLGIASLVTGTGFLVAGVRYDATVRDLRVGGVSEPLLGDAMQRASTSWIVADATLVGAVGFAIVSTLLYVTREPIARAPAAGCVSVVPGAVHVSF